MDNKKTEMNNSLKSSTESMLKLIGSYDGLFDGAYNLRENGSCAGRRSTKNIDIADHPSAPGLLITVAPGTKGEKVYVPACVTESGISDRVMNEFVIGEGADVQIVAGCGVHSEGKESLHSGDHIFHLAKNSRIEYLEKHIGTGVSDKKRIDTHTVFRLEEGASVIMISEQIGGVNNAHRDTTATLAENALLSVSERLLTDGDDKVTTEFTVTLDGDNSKADVVSRSVARGESYQSYVSRIEGNAICSGHTECDAILTENGRVEAAPCLAEKCPDAALIHEAAIGKIAGEQIIKLCSLGLTKEEAEKKIIEGFLK